MDMIIQKKTRVLDVRRLLLVGLCMMCCSLYATQVWAKSPGQKQEAMLFISEMSSVDSSATSEPTVSYWWENTKKPSLSAMQKSLKASLEVGGVSWPVNAGKELRISKIYRRPDLAKDNVIALGELLGSSKVYHGQVVYSSVDKPLLDGQPGVRVQAHVELLDLQAGHGDDTTILVERVVFASSKKHALRKAEQLIADELATMMIRHLNFTTGPVGPLLEKGGEGWIVLKGAEDDLHLELAKTRLLAVSEIESVRIAWAAKGYIALEINPDKDDSATIMESAKRSLAEDVSVLGSSERWRWNSVMDDKLAGGVVFEFVEVPPQELEIEAGQ